MLIFSASSSKNKDECSYQTIVTIIIHSDSGSSWRVHLRAGQEKCTAQVLPRLGKVSEDGLQGLRNCSGVVGDNLPLQPPSLFFCPQLPAAPYWQEGRKGIYLHPAQSW